MAFQGRFNEKAQQAMTAAQEAARRLGHDYVGTEHLLLGLMRELSPTIQAVMGELTYERVFEKAERLVGHGDSKAERPPYTPRTRKILEQSHLEAGQLESVVITPEHIWLSLLREGEGVAARILQDVGINLRTARERILTSLKEGEGQNPATPTLDQYGRDLTAAAVSGELDPVIGRAMEIERITQILIRRTKNNPVLIGEPGVGKSAIVEGLAQRIAAGIIPSMLKGKRVFSLDVASMLAGSKYRGEFEERFKNAVSEIKKNGNILLFIDEMHTLVGAGGAEGAIDASNMIKPALARGEIQVIGATTLDEYKKRIERDPALERRFQPVIVGEPTREEALSIIQGLRERYEAHHRLTITDDALSAAVELSDRYIADRFLPDKAIDLMDEAASRVRIRAFTPPPDMKVLEEQLQEIIVEKDAAVNSQHFETAARLRDKERALRADMENARAAWEDSQEVTGESVTEAEIAEIVAQWTGVPIQRMTQDESDRLLKLEDTLHARLIGQEEAVTAVARAIRRARAGLKDEKRPIGSFLFLGPTGVGKTELCRALSDALFGDEDAMIRVDMSEYMEKHSISRMIGSPPGYIGHEEGGQLTEKVRRKPYAVLLFDEIEKAHLDVFNLLLQLLDDGRLTDAKGRTVSFKNTVVVMTSNIGASMIAEGKRLGFGTQHAEQAYVDMKDKVLREVKNFLRPEFLNRLDEIIVFRSLSEVEVHQICTLLLGEVTRRLLGRGVSLTFDEKAVAHLATAGFDPAYGARPLKRVITHEIEDALSEELLSGRVQLGDTVQVTAVDEKIVFEKQVLVV